jgi:SAM-dependent methyltransferase
MSYSPPPAQQVARSLDRVDWDFADENPSAPNMRLNGVHWYPATFIAPLVANMLDILAPDGRARILDPFSGSGMAPLEAWFRGHAAIGSDINSFAIALSRSRVKLVREGNSVTGERLSTAFRAFHGEARMDDASTSLRRDEAAAEVDRWFVPDAVQDIAVVKDWIERKAPERWRTTLRVLLSSVLKRCSRVRDYHYTYIVDRSRVKAPAESNPELARQFAERVEFSFRAGANTRAALREQGRMQMEKPPTFTRAPAGNLAHIGTGEIDIVLTSPPYFGMNDYVRSQYLTSLVYPSKSFDRDLGVESGSRRMRSSEPALRRYLDDMGDAFRESHRVLRKGGLIAIFIGHSQSKLAREANVLGQLTDTLEGLGFDPIWQGERRIRFRKITSTPSSSEHVWILRRR